MGLDDPERDVWRLKQRFLPSSPPGLKCPEDEEFLVIPRNFDMGFNYSSYVNECFTRLYIDPNACTGGNPLAYTLLYPADFFADAFTSVAGIHLSFGGYYIGLTQDDVAGLAVADERQHHQF